MSVCARVPACGWVCLGWDGVGEGLSVCECVFMCEPAEGRINNIDGIVVCGFEVALYRIFNGIIITVIWCITLHYLSNLSCLKHPETCH